MDSRFRRRLHAAAWLTFLIGAPLLLAYTRGYRIPWHDLRRGTYGTPAIGALVIRTVPRGATVSLDGTIVDERTPTGIGSVPARPHRIRLTKEGYRPWEKSLTVRGGEVTHAFSVRLLPVTIPEEMLRAGVHEIWPSPNGRLFVVQEPGRLRVLTLRELATGEGRTYPVRAREAAVLRVAWAPDGDAVALLRAHGDAPPLLWGVLDLGRHALSRLSGTEAFLGWTLHGNAGLVVQDQDGGVWIRQVAGARERIALRALLVAPHPEGMLTVQEASPGDPLSLLLRRGGGRDLPVAGRLDPPVQQLSASSAGGLAAIVGKGRRLDILPPGTDTWTSVAPGVQSVQWSPDGEKLLFQQSPFDVSVVNVSEARSVLPAREPVLVLRRSLPLTGLQWFPDSQHLLFGERDILSLLDIDPRDGHRLESLASVNRGVGSIGVVEDGDTLLVPAVREGRNVLLSLSLRVPSDR